MHLHWDGFEEGVDIRSNWSFMARIQLRWSENVKSVDGFFIYTGCV